MTNNQLLYTLASSVNGIVLGTNLFAGAVDGRMLTQLLEENEPKDVVSTVFSAWWSSTPSLMIPLSIGGLALNAAAFFVSEQPMWLVGIGSHVSSLLWGAVVMRNSVKALSGPLPVLNVKQHINQFITLHYARIAFSGLGLYAGNVALLSLLRKTIVV